MPGDEMTDHWGPQATAFGMRISVLEGQVAVIMEQNRATREVIVMHRAESIAASGRVEGTLQKAEIDRGVLSSKLDALIAMKNKGDGAYIAIVKILAGMVATGGFVLALFQYMRPLH